MLGDNFILEIFGKKTKKLNLFTKLQVNNCNYFSLYKLKHWYTIFFVGFRNAFINFLSERREFPKICLIEEMKVGENPRTIGLSITMSIVIEKKGE